MNDLAFVVRKGDKGWVIRSQTILGEGPVGPRLAKGSNFPSEFGLTFKDKREADAVAEKWEQWYYGQSYLRKKRKSKYLA
jgi:hypothetical protein